MATTALAASSSSALQAEQAFAPGQWKPTELTKPLEELLWVSLEDVWGYQPGTTKYICVKSVQSVSTQQVFGTNYLFSTMACDVNNWFEVGDCTTNSNCNARPTQVQLNVNPTIHKLQVNRIELISLILANSR